MAIRGDFLKLDQLTKRLEEIARPGFKKRMIKVLGATARTLVMREFMTSKDPYGNPWAPIKRKGQILRDTGRLMNSFSAQPTENGFTITTNVAYAAVHQDGASIKAHARAGGQIVAFNKKGRFTTKAKAGKYKGGARIYITKDRKQAAFKIPRRQMIPEQATGGMGPIWAAALNKSADEALRAQVKL